MYASVEAYSCCGMTFDPYNFEEVAWNAGQYKAEMAMNRLVSKYLHSRAGYCYEKSVF